MVVQAVHTKPRALDSSLGYTSSPSSLDMPTTTALKVTRPRKTERRQKKVTRNVFLCYVVGAAGSGKTSLLRSFLSKRFRGGEQGDVGYEPTSRTMSAVNSVEMGGGEKYLVVSKLWGSPSDDLVALNSRFLTIVARVWVEIRERSLA